MKNGMVKESSRLQAVRMLAGTTCSSLLAVVLVLGCAGKPEERAVSREEAFG